MKSSGKHSFPTRPTFGFLSATIHTGASRDIWLGVLEEARRLDVNLVCFPGGRLLSPDNDERMRNHVFRLAGPETMNGILSWATSLGGYASKDDIADFHKRFGDVPVVTLAQKIFDHPAVLLDSYDGMRQLVNHLVEAHGMRKIAFICGPQFHISARERYQAYCDSLQAHGIRIVDKLISSPVSWDEGSKAILELLVRRKLVPGKDFQAVVASSDLLALHAVKTLEARSWRVPEDVAVCGFNDTRESRIGGTLLTTVSMPFWVQGRRGLSLLHTHASGRQHVSDVNLKSSLIVRQSCSCTAAELELCSMDPPEPWRTVFADAERDRDDWMNRCMVATTAVMNLDEASADAWLLPLLHAVGDGTVPPDQDEFLRLFRKVLDRIVISGGDPQEWQRALSVIRREYLSVVDPPDHRTFEDLVARGRVLIADIQRRSLLKRQWESEDQSRRLRAIGDKLRMTFDTARLCRVLKDEIPGLGIPGVWLVLARKDSTDTVSHEIVLSCRDDACDLMYPDARPVPSGVFLPSDMRPRKRHTLVVESLYFLEEYLGYIIFETGPSDPHLYEELRSHVAGALKGALLFARVQEAKQAAARADRVKTRLLANVSGELRTPLNLILHYAEKLREKGGDPDALVSSIEADAKHQLQVVNDLLDLSKSEIGAIELDFQLLDPAPIVREAFESFSLGRKGRPDPDLQPDDRRPPVPESLPFVRADVLRFRQVLFNLFANVEHRAGDSPIRVGAQAEPPWLHLWVGDSCSSLDSETSGMMFEPFVGGSPGSGLGLAVTRHVVGLHGGTIRVETREGGGTFFHVYLPFPALQGVRDPDRETDPVMFRIGSSRSVPGELQSWADDNGIEIRILGDGSDWTSVRNMVPRAIIWSMGDFHAFDTERETLRRFRNENPDSSVPVLLYAGNSEAGGKALMSFLRKQPGVSDGLFPLLDTGLSPGSEGTVLVCDDDPASAAAAVKIVRSACPQMAVREFHSGDEVLSSMSGDVPRAVVLDFAMPGTGGIDVLEAMRSDARLRHVAVLLLTDRVPTEQDVSRIEDFPGVIFQMKGIMTEEETTAVLLRLTEGKKAMPPKPMVKRATGWIVRNYQNRFSRWQVADYVNTNEDHLTREFRSELAMGPWEFLTRYRILAAKKHLLSGNAGIADIAARVGFPDSGYFCRVFRKQTGMSPQTWRDTPHNA